jgi:uncharacterized protein YggE
MQQVRLPPAHFTGQFKQNKRVTGYGSAKPVFTIPSLGQLGTILDEPKQAGLVAIPR